VLIVGPGSGAEIRGAAAAGCNVTAVESDHAQFMALQTMLCREAERQANALQSTGVFDTEDEVGSQSTSLNSSKDNGEAAALRQAEQGVTCLECLGKIEVEGQDVSRMCSVCPIKCMLHENCCVKITEADQNGICLYRCLTCQAKVDLEEEDDFSTGN
jgi:hypothetical protein